MKKRDYADYIEDINSAISDIQEFTKDVEFAEFSKDKKTIYAVVRALEVIGEASRQIPSSIKNRYPQVPWKEMIGIRNKITHEYFGVNLQVIWTTVKQDIPSLKQNIINILNDLTKK